MTVQIDGQTLKTSCECCGAEFEPETEMTFICDGCHEKLLPCPRCQSDDVTFDWQINEPYKGYVYYYSVRCNECEREIRVNHNLGDGEIAAKKVFAEWQTR